MGSTISLYFLSVCRFLFSRLERVDSSGQLLPALPAWADRLAVPEHEPGARRRRRADPVCEPVGRDFEVSRRAPAGAGQLAVAGPRISPQGEMVSTQPLHCRVRKVLHRCNMTVPTDITGQVIHMNNRRTTVGVG